MKRPPLPTDAKIDWDHIFLVAYYTESGESCSSWSFIDSSVPAVNVVVTDIVLGTNLVSQDNKMLSIPNEITNLDKKLEFAKQQNGTLAEGFYFEECIGRQLSKNTLRLRRMKEEQTGIFSFISVDTKEPIISRLHEVPKIPQVIKMVYKDREGNIHVAIENQYKGYGIFGVIDIFDTVVWMNDLSIDSYEDNRWGTLKSIPRELRNSGIDFLFDKTTNGEYPQLFLGELPPLETILFTTNPKHD